ncbi:MAG: alpha/beta hydrolase [Pirellulaceae bacterium]|nr:alpha/beta hydrolase [Pirellulaceae bacterium]
MDQPATDPVASEEVPVEPIPYEVLPPVLPEAIPGEEPPLVRLGPPKPLTMDPVGQAYSAAREPDRRPASLNSYSVSPPEAEPRMPLRALPGEIPSGEKSADEESVAAPVATTATDPDYQVVEVFYGTDRRPLDSGPLSDSPSLLGPSSLLRPLLPAGVAFAAGLLALALGWRMSRRRTVLVVVGAICLVAGTGLALARLAKLADQQRSIAEHGRAYGNDRGVLELGICHVSIPKSHRIGTLEAPTLLRLEVKEDVRKHVVLRRVQSYAEQEFYDLLRERVARSPHEDLFIFVHGYNVTFEDAARRTAQIAYDLKFPGAPIFFSWPSQGGLLKYTVDETNVTWTVPHLKQFLVEVSRRSGARAVNLVAHSMGNRALTSALRELKYELQAESALFNQVVLAAPDIDAEVFRRDIAPAIQSTARRITLYASSDDQALIASRRVHGYARAGDSGAGIVVIPGIETIDVSGIDTSLLGHEYYGNSHSILADLYEVIRRGQPAAERRWLLPLLREGLTYWRLQPEATTTAAGTSDDLIRQ